MSLILKVGDGHNLVWFGFEWGFCDFFFPFAEVSCTLYEVAFILPIYQSNYLFLMCVAMKFHAISAFPISNM